MKCCSKCKQLLPLDNFHKSKTRASGYQGYCKECTKRPDYSKKYREDNRDKLVSDMKQYYEDNKDKLKINMSAYYEDNIESIKRKHKEHYQNNKSLYSSYRVKRKAALRKATPKWLSRSQLKEIHSFYKESLRLRNETGIMFHVDHIVPLGGENVCGLHVPWNLQILTEKENLAKGNKHE